MTGSHVLAIDLGTSGPKVALVSERGEVLRAASRRVETVRLPGGGAEQDPNAIWNSVADAAREVVAGSGVQPDGIVGIGVASQFSSIVAVDEVGQPLSQLILWMDSRGAPYAQKLLGTEGAALSWLERHGLLPLPSGADSLSKILWLRENFPAVYHEASAFLEPMDYLAARLTGRRTANPCSAFMMLLTDNRDASRIGWDDELVALAGMDAEKLPELVRVGADVGPLRPEVAVELGLSTKTRVYSGHTDNAAVAFGAGTASPGVGGVNVGTTGQVMAHSPRRGLDVHSGIVSTPSAMSDRFYVLAEIGLAGGSLDHLFRKVFFASDTVADHSAPDPFEGFEVTLARTEPGAGGLLFLPWMSGATAPKQEPAMRGGFLNWSIDTGRPEMTRAVVEGITNGLRWLLPEVEAFCDDSFASLRFSGGAAVSDGWTQIMADVLQRPIEQMEDPRHVINRTSAFLAFCERGESDRSQLEVFCPVRSAVEPGAMDPRYETHFEQFVEAFDRTQPIFQALNNQ